MDMNRLKRQAAIWLMRRLPIADRRMVIKMGTIDLMRVQRWALIEGFMPDGFHWHKNPVRKEKP